MMTTITRQSRRNLDSHSRGFGLIELMIAIAISLMVVLAISSLFLVQKRSYSTQDDLSRLQENGRYLVQELTRATRHAGYRDIQSTGNFGANPIIDGTDGSDAESDSLTVRFFGSSNLAGTADGSVVDCAGNAIDRDTMVTQTFSIIEDDDETPSLACTLGANASLILLPNVENMQILYGEDADQDGSVDRFRPAGTADMELVKSVMISFVLRTPTTNHPASANLVFNHFGTEYAPANVAPSEDAGSVFTAADDKRVRKQFAFSAGLRNRLD